MGSVRLRCRDMTTFLDDVVPGSINIDQGKVLLGKITVTTVTETAITV